MIDLLLEKYLDATKVNGWTIEIFKNPSKRELKEVEKFGTDQGFEPGFRFIIDFKTKDVYVWTNRIIHQDIIRVFGMKYWDNLKYDSYVDTGARTDRFFFGHVYHGDTLSDTWQSYEWRLRKVPQKLPIKHFEKMASYDKSWLKQYGINPRHIQNMVDAAVKAYYNGVKKSA